jgi:hypothetical protein
MSADPADAFPLILLMACWLLRVSDDGMMIREHLAQQPA